MFQKLVEVKKKLSSTHSRTLPVQILHLDHARMHFTDMLWNLSAECYFFVL